MVMERNSVNFPPREDFRYHYSSHNLRDPFLPLVRPQKRELNHSFPEQSRTESPKWKLLGILSGMLGIYASIQNSEGKRFIVTNGSVISAEGLIVKRISETELELGYLEGNDLTMNKGPSENFLLGF